MSAPLISPARRASTVWLCVAATIGFALLAGWIAHRSSTAFDDWMFEELYEHISSGGASLLLGFSEPALPITLCAAVAIIGAIVRRWDFVTLAVVGPTLTVVLTKWVFKPLLGRTLGTDQLTPVLGPFPYTEGFSVTGAFPSGHESAVASAACLLAIVTMQLPLTRRSRVIAFVVIAVWTVVAALGLVRNFWHYATDTIGAMLLAAVIVVGLALLIDTFGTTMTRLVHAARQEPARRS